MSRRMTVAFLGVIALLSSCSDDGTERSTPTAPASAVVPPTAPSTTATVPTTIATTTTSTTIATTTVPPPPPTFANWAETIEGVQTGVVRLEGRTCTGSYMGAGTGFLLAPHLVATAAHVVQDAGRLSYTNTEQRTALPAYVVGLDIANDVALLRIDPLPGGHVFEFDVVAPPAGTDIGVIGFTGGGMVRRPTKGSVSAPAVINVTYGDDREHRPALVIQHDAPTNQGDSGAPIVDIPTGRVLGINVAGQSFFRDGRPAAGINYAVQSAVAAPILQGWVALPAIDPCAPPPPPTTTTAAPTTVPTTAPTTTTTGAPVAGGSYRVLPGDTLFGIARAFRTTVPEILAVNAIADPNSIEEDQPIILPANARPIRPADVISVPYVVVAGDTVIAIAALHGSTPAEILAVNSMLAAPDRLQVGQTLLIPQR